MPSTQRKEFQLFKQFSDAVFVCKQDGKPLFANNRLERLLEIPASDLAKRSFQELFPACELKEFADQKMGLKLNGQQIQVKASCQFVS